MTTAELPTVEVRNLGDRATNYLNTLNPSRMGAATSERSARMLASLGHPERRYRTIHVTGTNGKGSTAVMASALLRAEGMHVGTFTGPHVVDVSERIVINGAPCKGADLSMALEHVERSAWQLRLTPTWFEALTVAALWLFAERGIGVAVVEVGRLGRTDPTNVLGAEVAVVTNVALDHTELAGPTRACIAHEKAGIITPGATVILGERDIALRPYFTARRPAAILVLDEDIVSARLRETDHGSRFDVSTPWGSHPDVPLPILGHHQRDNAALAVAAVEALGGAPISKTSLQTAFTQLGLPARLEPFIGKPTVLLDGGHNPAAAGALAETLAARFPGTARTFVFAQLAGRDPERFLRAVNVGSGDRVFCTTSGPAEGPQVEVIARTAQALGASAVPVPEPGDALRRAIAATNVDGIVVVCGSFRLAGAVRPALVSRSDVGRSVPTLGSRRHARALPARAIDYQVQ